MCPPTAPTDLQAQCVSNDSVQLSWQPTASDRQTPITGYVIERQGDGDTDYITCQTVGPKCGSYVVRQLPRGSIQKFRVRPLNKSGLSDIAELQEPIEIELPSGWYVFKFN